MVNSAFSNWLAVRAVPGETTAGPLVRLTLVLVCLNLSWRVVRYAAGFPLFGDEAFVANNFLLKDFWGLAGSLEHYQIVSLVFLWAEWMVVKLSGLSEWSLRFVSFTAGLLSVFVFVRIALRFLPRVQAIFAVGIFCASYYPVRHATEVKPYSLDILCAMLILLTALEYLREPDRRHWLIWTLVCGLGVWASYPSSDRR